jgi:uridine kinase
VTNGLAPAAAAVVELALGRTALLAGCRLVCIDGPAGSGKTSLATAVESRALALGLSVSLVHLDDVYDGWDGLPTVGATLLETVVRPLAERRAAAYRRYDWYADRYAETRSVPASDLVVLEGVGAGHPGYAHLVTLLVWVEAPAALRLRRGLARDGADSELQLRAWQGAEDELHAQEETRRRAQLRVDGVTGEVVDHQSGA